MPKRNGLKLIPDFLLPNLNHRTYGEHLQWVDEKSGTFQITWMHQSKGEWKEEDHCTVFKDWAIMKKLWDPEDPKRASKAKHRFRSALRRQSSITIEGKKSQYNVYRLVKRLETKINLDLSKLSSTNMEEASIDHLSADDENLLSEEDYEEEDDNDFHANWKQQMEPADETRKLCAEMIENLQPKIPNDFCNSQDQAMKIFWENPENSDSYEICGNRPNYLSSTRCCDILPDSPTLHNPLCLWSSYN